MNCPTFKKFDEELRGAWTYLTFPPDEAYHINQQLYYEEVIRVTIDEVSQITILSK